MKMRLENISLCSRFKGSSDIIGVSVHGQEDNFACESGFSNGSSYLYPIKHRHLDIQQDNFCMGLSRGIKSRATVACSANYLIFIDQ